MLLYPHSPHTRIPGPIPCGYPFPTLPDPQPYSMQASHSPHPRISSPIPCRLPIPHTPDPPPPPTYPLDMCDHFPLSLRTLRLMGTPLPGLPRCVSSTCVVMGDRAGAAMATWGEGGTHFSPAYFRPWSVRARDRATRYRRNTWRAKLVSAACLCDALLTCLRFL